MPDRDPLASDKSTTLAAQLNLHLAKSALDPLSDGVAARFAEFCTLLLRWNARMNLTAVRDIDGILSRHFVESIACARALPAQIATLLDFGSGAGFPGIPIALCRPEIAVTLAESQGKKAAFLGEAIRLLGIPVSVHNGRAELLKQRFDCVTLRAVDRMEKAISQAIGLLADRGWLCVMTSKRDLEIVQTAAGVPIAWESPIELPGSESRMLIFGRRNGDLPVSRPV